MNYLNVTKQVFVDGHSTTNWTRDMLRAWLVAFVFVDVCGNEIFASLTPPASKLMSHQVANDGSPAPFAEWPVLLFGSDDNVLKK